MPIPSNMCIHWWSIAIRVSWALGQWFAIWARFRNFYFFDVLILGRRSWDIDMTLFCFKLELVFYGSDCCSIIFKAPQLQNFQILLNFLLAVLQLLITKFISNNLSILFIPGTWKMLLSLIQTNIPWFSKIILIK